MHVTLRKLTKKGKTNGAKSESEAKEAVLVVYQVYSIAAVEYTKESVERTDPTKTLNITLNASDIGGTSGTVTITDKNTAEVKDSKTSIKNSTKYIFKDFAYEDSTINATFELSGTNTVDISKMEAVSDVKMTNKGTLSGKYNMTFESKGTMKLVSSEVENKQEYTFNYNFGGYKWSDDKLPIEVDYDFEDEDKEDNYDDNDE